MRLVLLSLFVCLSSASAQQIPLTILVHGGAGDVSADVIEHKYNASKVAVRVAYATLESGGSAMDAVVDAVKVLEDDKWGNAGRGSVLNAEGRVQMDASVMDGATMSAGAVGAARRVRNPVEAARVVMDRTRHVMLAGDEVAEWAQTEGLAIEEESYFVTYERFLQWLEWLEDQNKESDKWSMAKGTVGAVAIDAEGNVAAATSTGGTVGKLPGRVGDTPGVGHGVYADITSAGVSCTGTGETFIRATVARRVAQSMEEANPDINEAINEALNYMTQRVGGEGGVIALSPLDGQIGIGWNSKQMSWAYGREGKLHYGLNVGEDFVEDM